MVRFAFLLFLLIASKQLLAQCTSHISSFPYVENFDVNNGGWVAGGTASTWAWGAPTKPVISSAAGGSGKCWVVGGLTGGSYANNESSYVVSPCFDFSSLQHPQVAFSLFWESENKYDGAKLQYSLDGGTNWVDLGNMASNSDPCKAQNWYNYSTVKYLNNTQGWCGNKQPTVGQCVGGGGSNTWKNAWHIMDALAGKPSVRFRFLFGAGSQCNNYDGFAFDNFKVQEGYPYSAAFNFQCTGPSNVQFEALTTCAQTFVWNFGDAASGANNSSSIANPTHNFSAPGVYDVSLTATFVGAPPATVTKQVKIINVSTNITSAILCAGGNATISSTVSPAGTYDYSWNTNPVQSTPTASVPSGNYTLTVSGSNVCTNTANINVQAPPVIAETHQITNASCSPDGKITVNGSGGTGTLSYSWSNGATGQTIQTLAAGNYTVTIKDVNNCSKNFDFVVGSSAPNIVITPTIAQAGCTNNGTINLNVSGGATPYTYLWSNGSTQSNLTGLAAGTYNVVVTDANGCTKTMDIVVGSSVANVPFTWVITPPKCLTANGKIDIQLIGNPTGAITYAWSSGQTTKDIQNIGPGTYTLTITKDGCNTVKTFDVEAVDVPVNIAVANVQKAVCGAATGSIELTIAGEEGSAPYTILWSNGQTTQTATNLAAGSYNVTVKNTLGCDSTLNNIVVPDQQINISATPIITKAQCGNNGSIALNLNGLTATPTYTWSNGSTAPTLANIGAGTYSVHLQVGNCEKQIDNIVVEDIGLNLQAGIVVKNETCGNGKGSISLNLPNPAGFSILWSNGETTPSIQNLSTGNYSVTVSLNSCSQTLNNLQVNNINIEPYVYLGNDTTICPGNVLKLWAGGFNSFLWQDGSTLSTFDVATSGTYKVQVVDANGCVGADSIRVLVDCSDVFFPNAFTPGNDGLNNNFGAVGNIGALKKYHLYIYNRYGEKVFESVSPYLKWSGNIKANGANSQVFVWFSTYEINGKRFSKKGTVLLIR